MKSQTTQERVSLISLFHGITYSVMTVLQAFRFPCWVGRPRPAFDLQLLSKGNKDEASGIDATSLQWRVVGFRVEEAGGRVTMKQLWKCFSPINEFDTKLLRRSPLLDETKTCSTMYVKGRSFFFLLLRWEEKHTRPWWKRSSNTQLPYLKISILPSAISYFSEPPRVRKTLFFSNKASVVTFSDKMSLLHAAHDAWPRPSWAQPKCLHFPESQSWRSHMGLYRLLLFRIPDVSPKALGLAAAISVHSQKAKEQKLWGRRLKMD